MKEMKEDLKKAKSVLLSEGLTCVLVRGEDVVRSRVRGVKPLLELIDGRKDMRGFSAGDKVVGRAAAFLYVILGVDAVYAGMMTKGAVTVFAEYGIMAYYDSTADTVMNRAKDDLCPMEKAVADTGDPFTALHLIRDALSALGSPGDGTAQQSWT